MMVVLLEKVMALSTDEQLESMKVSLMAIQMVLSTDVLLDWTKETLTELLMDFWMDGPKVT